MKTIKNTTKQARGFIRAYNYHFNNDNNNHGNSLFEIYKSFSKDKDDALKDCLKLRSDLNGFNACFCGWSPDFFSYGFLTNENGKRYLIYITYRNTYKIELSEGE